MTIVLTGGGSGGHITPLLAVAHELKAQDPNLQLVYIGERGGRFADLTKDNKDITTRYSVQAGKLRRYNGRSLLAHLLDVKTNVLNMRDAFKVLVGFFQALRLLSRLKPGVVFIKGGFVGVPVGLACALLRIPYVTHDSDTLPGLANRLIARWARWHTVGMPVEFYTYPKERTRWVGIPLASEYQTITPALQQSYKQQLGLGVDTPMLLVTGGSLGAKRLNTMVHRAVPSLLEESPKLVIIHQVGKGNSGLYADLDTELAKRFTEKEFITDMQIYSGAADVVVTRAGATTIAELALQHKACIVVPNPVLTSGHQLKNAQHLQAQQAVEVVNEEAGPEALAKAVSALLDSPQKRSQLSTHIAQLAKPHAAEDISELLLHIAKGDPATHEVA